MMSGTTNLMTDTIKFAAPTSGIAPVAVLAALGLPQASASGISITIAPEPVSVTPGVRVAGRIRGSANRSIYLSGRPGTLYSDGTFEFHGVAPGRHTLLTLDNPSSLPPLGASVVVGTRDVEDVVLEELLILPFDSNATVDPLPAGAHPSGSVVPLASIRGRVVDEATRMPLDAGRITLNSNSLTYALNMEGRFEIPRLLPGIYNLEVWAYGVGSISRSVVVDDQNIELDLEIRGPN
jgi:hypothetical protein